MNDEKKKKKKKRTNTKPCTAYFSLNDCRLRPVPACVSSAHIALEFSVQTEWKSPFRMYLAPAPRRSVFRREKMFAQRNLYPAHCEFTAHTRQTHEQQQQANDDRIENTLLLPSSVFAVQLSICILHLVCWCKAYGHTSMQQQQQQQNEVHTRASVRRAAERLRLRPLDIQTHTKWKRMKKKTHTARGKTS